MRKRWFLVGVMFLLVLWLLVGCGIPQDQYDATVSDLSKAQQELQSVKSELETAQTKVSELTSSLEKSKTELEAAQAKNSELTSNLGKSQTELEVAQAKNSELTSSLEKSRSELSSVRSEYSSFKSEAKRLWTLLDGNLLLNHAILGIYSGDLLNDLDRIHDQCMIATGGLAELKDLKKAITISD